MSLQFTPDGRYLVICGDKTQTWKIEPVESGDQTGGLPPKRLKSQRGGYGMVVSPDNRHLAFYNEVLHLWDFENDSPPLRVAMDVTSSVQCATFTPDGRQLLYMNRTREIVALDVATGNKVSSFPTGASKSAQTFDYRICTSPGGSRLAVTSESDRGLDIWDLKTGTRLYALPDGPGTGYWLAGSPDGCRAAIARDNGKINIWDLDVLGQILAKLGLNP